MAVYVLYSAWHPNEIRRNPSSLTTRLQPITLPGARVLYVRAELVDANLVDALDRAKPRKGETVLNSIETEDE